MEEIKEKISTLLDITIVSCLLVVIVAAMTLYQTSQIEKMNDKFNTILRTTRGLENTIRESQSTKINMNELFNNYQKLKSENEILLDKIQLYREKY